jgi:hypothetical protein
MAQASYEQGTFPISAPTRYDCIAALAQAITSEAIEQDITTKELLGEPGTLYRRLLPTGVRAHDHADERWVRRVLFSQL